MYADWWSDDTFWKLDYRWHADHNTPARAWVHPVLGWAPPKSAENPLGTVADRPYTPDFHRPTILFYGDSFVQGATAIDQNIAARLGRLLPEYAVYNFGVRGYGVDQTFLRMRDSAWQFDDGVILVGVLTVDLDRSLLTVRAGPKPYFVPQGERLALRGVPVPRDPARWFDDHPVQSYAFAWLRRRLQIVAWGAGGLSPWRRHATEAVNRRILEKVVRTARARGRALVFVIFYRRQELRSVGWRERFLKAELARLDAPYVDTKAVLDSRGADYLRDGHLNPRGNARVAAAIATALTHHACREPVDHIVARR